MPMTSKQMINYLKENGFETISQNGSHVKMYNPATNKTTIIPYHCKDLKKGLEQTILKQAGLR
jgi:predicted RNA binding protein YcfA (HicA-like mRNA interferase family)